MTGLRGSEFTSKTGARFQLNPTARISSAVAFATSKTRLGDRAAAIAIAPGNWVARSPSPYRETCHRLKNVARLGDYHSVFLIKGNEERSIMACGSGSLL
jgi:hypothetical protein